MAAIGYGKRGGGLKVELSGMLADKRELKRRGHNVEDLLDKEVLKTAIDTANISRKSIQRGIKTGTTYQKYEPRRTHRASAEKEPPATDTGRLVSSITQKRTGHAEAEVGSDVVYSKFLEFGTPDMGERPWLRPALKKAGKQFEERMFDKLGGRRTRLNKFMRKGARGD